MIPVTQTETTVYSPPSYDNLNPKPIFRFKPATPRSRRRFQSALAVEGLRFHGDEAVQAEIVRAMRALWVGDPVQLDANEARLKAFHETVRQARTDTTVVIDPAEAEAIMLAVARLTDEWPMLRRMNADNQRFGEDAPKLALGQFLANWSNLPTRYRLEDGVVPIEVIDTLEADMNAVEDVARADGVDGVIGIGFIELSSHALGLLNLDAGTEKNSPSPSSPSGTPNGSTADGSAVKSSNSGSGNRSSRRASAPRPPRKRANS